MYKNTPEGSVALLPALEGLGGQSVQSLPCTRLHSGTSQRVRRQHSRPELRRLSEVRVNRLRSW